MAVRGALDTRIVVSAPIGIMPPGLYFLTVSRGPASGDTASMDVPLGGGPPAAPPADRGRSDSTGPVFGAPDGVAAKIGDRSITLADVDREWQRTDPGSYIGVARRVHEMRLRVADKMVADDLLAREAAARGLSVEALLGEEIPKRTVPLPDSAALALYQQLGDDTRGASLEQMRPALRAWLARYTEPDLARMNYVEELMRVSTRADVLLPPPRIEVASSDADPSLGPAGRGGADRGVRRFAERPLCRVRASVRPRARERSAIGCGWCSSTCRRSIRNHWPPPKRQPARRHRANSGPFHDRVIAQSGPLGPTRTAELAAAAGLDRAAFDACRESGRFRRAIHEALEDARRYDVSASPSFLVNGRLAPVPPPFLPPFEFFTRLVEEELVSQKR